ncbi:MAG TPA: UDP-N-acetylglucosamine--N-acetylmuramyl-(pentapeptide) pyrophosphoryl-undecaprenol N-acetylglucosamine transferase, partial [Candidatus Omnitrophota bacterium]|nr:UDP-N-acetylglucosamine--N-acetylmuramyl-(pentapeptide) pyrophosphoryl-undecaprenol N-acetylglucosamine transferase [Candidatus Omnitrophota bacterium]
GAFPAVASAILLRYLAMIHEQNAVPGRANKILAKFVKKIAISFPAAARYFNEHKTVLTGCPCRLSQRPMDRAAIVRAFGLKDNKTTIFVFGGSQGSHSINEAFAACVPSLREILDFQAIHVSGKDDYLSLKDRYNEFGIPFALFDFLDKMEEAYHIADVVISRSGAATVSELAHFRLPSILIPYPHAQGHQRENASVLCQAGLAQMIEERDVTVSKMSEAILRILKDGKNINRKFDQICFPDAAQRLAREVTGLAQ